jgi:photosystem II stability/assembly factor-like uncharacterized protein
MVILHLEAALEDLEIELGEAALVTWIRFSRKPGVGEDSMRCMGFRATQMFKVLQVGLFSALLASCDGSNYKKNSVIAQAPSNSDAMVRFSVEATVTPKLFSQGVAIDDRHVWVVGSKLGTLMRSIDGGKSWQKLGLHSGDEIKFGKMFGMHLQIYFVTSARGWLCADSGTWQTEDGGETWRQVFTGLISGMHFSELENGWLNLVGEAWQQSYVTRDGGQSWQVYGGRRGLNDPSPTSAYFFDRDQGWAITSKKVDRQFIFSVVRTKDGGLNWEEVWTAEKINPDEICHSLYFLDAKKGWMAAEGGLYKSEDGGRQWTPIDLPDFIVGVNEVYFADRSNGWIVAKLRKPPYSLALLATNDGGKAWQRFTEGEVINILRGEHPLYQMPEKWKYGRLLKAIASH